MRRTSRSVSAAVGLERGQRRPLDELGDEVAGAVLLAGVEQRRRCRGGPGGRRRSASRRARSGGGAVGGDDLDRHAAVQALVVGGVHGAEAAGAEPAAEPVAAQDQAVGGGRDDRLSLLREGARSLGFARARAGPFAAARRTRRAATEAAVAAGPYSGLPPNATSGDLRPVSFFDEDDEPTRTRRTARARARAAPAAGGPAGVDHQTLWTRRAVAIGRRRRCSCSSCSSSSSTPARTRAARTRCATATARRPRSSRSPTTQVGQPFFEHAAAGRQPVARGPADPGLQPARPGREAAQAGRSSSTRRTSMDRRAAARCSMALELRRDGLDYIAQRDQHRARQRGRRRPTRRSRGSPARCRPSSPPTSLIRTRVTPLIARGAQGRRRRRQTR